MAADDIRAAVDLTNMRRQRPEQRAAEQPGQGARFSRVYDDMFAISSV
ncbi:hypothetical protein ACS8Y6_08825 [Salinisphaera sp. RV14]